MCTRILSSVFLVFLSVSCSVPPDRTPELNPDPTLLYAAHGQPGGVVQSLASFKQALDRSVSLGGLAERL